MDQRNADWYREQATGCLARAEKAADSRIKEFNQAEAQSWLRLAELTIKVMACTK
jgi:hypothetical protein